MAVWQCDIALVPRAGIIRHHGEIPEELPGFRAVWHPEQEPDEGYPSYWEAGEPPETLAPEISHLLLPRESWSKKALMFGNEEGNTAEIWLGESLHFRFDVRKLDLELLRAVAVLASSHDLLWVSDRMGQPLAPALEQVLKDIQASDAFRFCKDPLGYLKALPKDARGSEQGAPPNGGPAESLDDSGVGGGPPSVS